MPEYRSLSTDLISVAPSACSEKYPKKESAYIFLLYNKKRRIIILIYIFTYFTFVKEALTIPIINNYQTFVNEKNRKCEKIIIFLEKLICLSFVYLKLKILLFQKNNTSKLWN
ncbi:hypothetical protein C0966_10970 [Bacillus methanolicus]|nr:hypothetical protein [Bacillus methanolicus]